MTVSLAPSFPVALSGGGTVVVSMDGRLEDVGVVRVDVVVDGRGEVTFDICPMKSVVGFTVLLLLVGSGQVHGEYHRTRKVSSSGLVGLNLSSH